MFKVIGAVIPLVDLFALTRRRRRGNFGRILKGKITINLTEFAEEASSKKATAGSSNGGSSSPAGVSTGVGPRLSAITVGASSSDKAAKKPNNTQLT